jgi:bacterioferritin-associated ferredoxin
MSAHVWPFARPYVKKNDIDNHSHSRSNDAMIICVCKAVSDRHIRAAVKGGASCMRDLTRELRVGTCCGKCLPEAKAALVACLPQLPRTPQRNESSSPGFFPNPGAEFAT